MTTVPAGEPSDEPGGEPRDVAGDDAPRDDATDDIHDAASDAANPDADAAIGADPASAATSGDLPAGAPGSVPPAGSVPPPGWQPAAGPVPPPGYPPPPGYGPAPGPFPRPGTIPPPPPGTGGYATRYGLYRPRQGRYVAGVCAAIGRATNTDPVLWRVLLPVLTLVGGLGALIYVVGWLAIPAEGDTASPIESLLGRGRSSTAPVITIALMIIVAFTLLGGVTRIGNGFLVAAAIIGGFVLLITADGGNRPLFRMPDRPIPPPPAAGPFGPQAGFGPAGGTATMNAPATPAPVGWPAGGPGTAVDAPGPEAPQTQPVPGAAPLYDDWYGTYDGPAGFADPIATDPIGTYQPPFAPHGPFAGPTTDLSGLPPEPVPVPPAPPRRRNITRRITLSCAVLAVGLLAVLDTSNVANVSAATYFATALGVVGAGLVIGGFAGRAYGRGPIFIGFLLTACLAAASLVGHVDGRFQTQNMQVTANSAADVQPDYSVRIGRIQLDLSSVDFAHGTRTINLNVSVGEIDVILPPDVTAVVDIRSTIGDATAFGHSSSGINREAVTVTDPGTATGGTVYINAKVTIGHVEVHR